MSQVALKTLAKRLIISLNTPRDMSLEQTEGMLAMVYQVYFKAGPNLPKWREKFQLGLVHALAEDKEKSPAIIKAQMKR